MVSCPWLLSLITMKCYVLEDIEPLSVLIIQPTIILPNVLNKCHHMIAFTVFLVSVTFTEALLLIPILKFVSG
ncbi:hypothetical protein Xish_00638 [Xenorhabdus ishibashii]|uniref:Uncharacterized protein n=1 Tax=Xenorhabdus ishibashii TaxID=1034471 RepID=A0A2D0KDQ4_9GAMM|nr:hypothetical protein Xish_00638 [Xenorhabdus ishibashii]